MSRQLSLSAFASVAAMALFALVTTAGGPDGQHRGAGAFPAAFGPSVLLD